jgi:hypothetical protein
MNLFLMPSNKIDDILLLTQKYDNFIVYNYIEDCVEMDKLYIKNKDCSFRLMPISWLDYDQPMSLSRIAFANINRFENVYIHNFKFPGAIIYNHIKDKLKGKNVFITMNDDFFTQSFFDTSKFMGLAKEIHLNDLSMTKKEKLIKLLLR